MKFTPASIRALQLPEGISEKTFFDDDLACFGVRLREGDTCGSDGGYVIQYKIGRINRRMTLGAVSALALGKARSTAKDLLAMVRLGRDPAGEKLEARQKVSVTYGAVLPRFLARQRSRLKPRSYEETERHLVVHCKPLHGMAIEKIDRRTVALRLVEIDETKGPAAANRTRASLSACFAWLLREGIVETNPVLNTNKAIEVGARERVLLDDELGAIWRGLADDQYSTIVKLLCLTGARRDEIASLRWSEIDLDRATITLPPARTKNKRVNLIPLAPAVVALLQVQERRLDADGKPRDLVFGFGSRGWQDWSGSKADLDARIAAAAQDGEALAGWRLHDFRRSMSTTMHERLGVMPHVVEACLGHVNGGVAGIYNQSDYLDLKRIALAKWADHVLSLTTGKKTATVVNLRRG
jgi:integrase